MTISRAQMNRQLYEGGGITSLKEARDVLQAEALPGEFLAYINPQEAAMLKYMGGAGIPINSSGVPSFFVKKIGKAISGAVKGVTKTVKKIASSDVGKLALLAAGAYFAPMAFGQSAGFANFGNLVKTGLVGAPTNLITGEAAKAGLLGTGGVFAPSVGSIATTLAGPTGFTGISSLMPSKGSLIAGGLGLLGGLFGSKQQAQQAFKRDPQGVKNYLVQYYKNINKKATDEEANQFAEEQTREYAAGGGIMGLPMGEMRENQAGIMERDYRDEGGFVPVGIKEKADDVPAMLSKNEFVFTADAVRGAGDGDVEKGAQRLYNTMKTLENGGTV